MRNEENWRKNEKKNMCKICLLNDVAREKKREKQTECFPDAFGNSSLAEEVFEFPEDQQSKSKSTREKMTIPNDEYTKFTHELIP